MGTIAPLILEELQEESRKWEQSGSKKRDGEHQKWESKGEDNHKESKTSKNDGEKKEGGKPETDKKDEKTEEKNSETPTGRKINGKGKKKCEEDPECIDFNYRYSNTELAGADYED